MPPCADSCQHDVSPDAAHPGHELCTLSFKDGDGWSYYLVMIEGGSRDTVSVRGFKTDVSPSAGPTGRPTIHHLYYHLLNFSITTSILSGLANAQLEGEIQTSSIRLIFPFPDLQYSPSADFWHANAPFASCDGAGAAPHGALLFFSGLRHPSRDTTAPLTQPPPDPVTYDGTVSIAGFREGLSALQTLVAAAGITTALIFTPAAYHFADRVNSIGIEAQVNFQHKTLNITGTFKAEPGTAPASRPLQQP
jgi:hypothetical protein